MQIENEEKTIDTCKDGTSEMRNNGSRLINEKKLQNWFQKHILTDVEIRVMGLPRVFEVLEH